MLDRNLVIKIVKIVRGGAVIRWNTPLCIEAETADKPKSELVVQHLRALAGLPGGEVSSIV